MKYYLETSALVKRYRTEQGTATLHELFTNRLGEDVFVTSQLTIVELEATFARAFRAGTLSETTHRALLVRLYEDLGNVLTPLPLTPRVVQRAVDVARTYALRGGDAVQLAAAASDRDQSSGSAMFISSDRELLSAARLERGFQVLDPLDRLAMEQIRALRQ